MSAHRRTPSASRTVMTELVLPEDTNSRGDLFGGRVVALADKCGAIAALRHCRMPVVTASMDRIDFLRPVRSGMIVILTAEVSASFRHSMEVVVTVEAENPLSGERHQTCRALMTMVALDEQGHPAAVPTLELETEEEQQRAVRAEERRRHRIATRGKA